jgi:hypothetical protein
MALSSPGKEYVPSDFPFEDEDTVGLIVVVVDDLTNEGSTDPDTVRSFFFTSTASDGGVKDGFTSTASLGGVHSFSIYFFV